MKDFSRIFIMFTGFQINSIEVCAVSETIKKQIEARCRR